MSLDTEDRWTKLLEIFKSAEPSYIYPFEDDEPYKILDIRLVNEAGVARIRADVQKVDDAE